MEVDWLCSVGHQALELELFLDALETAVRHLGFAVEWVPQSNSYYAGWTTYRKSGTWLFIGDSVASREIAVSMSETLGRDLHWFEARCERDDKHTKLAYEAREVSIAGKFRPMPSTRLDGKNLHKVAYGKAEDRIQQLVDDLIGLGEDKSLKSHHFKLFRVEQNPQAHESEPQFRPVDSKRVEEMLAAIERGIVATLTRESVDRLLLSVVGEPGSGINCYANLATVNEFESRLTEDQRVKLQRPSIRPAPKDPRLPRRNHNFAEIDTRRLLAGILEVDRYSIDIDAPLMDCDMTREHLLELMRQMGDHFRVPIDDGLVNTLANEDTWHSVVQYLSLRDLGRFAYDKFFNERQWDRK